MAPPTQTPPAASSPALGAILADVAKAVTPHLAGLMGGGTKGAVMGAAAEAVAEHFHQCGVPGGAKFSLGFVCSKCSRFACQAHVYLTAAMPPAPVCEECIGRDFYARTGQEKR